MVLFTKEQLKHYLEGSKYVKQVKELALFTQEELDASKESIESDEYVLVKDKQLIRPLFSKYGISEDEVELVAIVTPPKRFIQELDVSTIRDVRQFLVLHDIHDPKNVSNILHLARHLHWRGVLSCNSVDPFSIPLIRQHSFFVFNNPVITVDNPEKILHWIEDNHVLALAADCLPKDKREEYLDDLKEEEHRAKLELIRHRREKRQLMYSDRIKGGITKAEAIHRKTQKIKRRKEKAKEEIERKKQEAKEAQEDRFRPKTIEFNTRTPPIILNNLQFLVPKHTMDFRIFLGKFRNDPLCLILSSEAHGVSKVFRNVFKVSVPIERVDSINVSTACAIILYRMEGIHRLEDRIEQKRSFFNKQ
jgi:tRNA G18 (ribose-2'-O)-methylase SpoU